MKTATKKEVTEALNTAKKYGYEMIVFQTDRVKRKSESNMPDYFLAGRGTLIFLELKLKSSRDKLSEGQKKIMNKIYNSHGIVGILDEENYLKIQELIIAGDTIELRKVLKQTLIQHKII